MTQLSLAQRFRTWRDYATFLARCQSRSARTFLVIDSALVVVGSLGAMAMLGGAFYAFVWPGLRVSYGAIKLPRALKQFRLAGRLRAEKRATLQKGGKTSTLTTIEPSDRQASLGFRRERLGKDVIIRSGNVDAALNTHDWRCSIGGGHYSRVSDAIRRNREFCLAHLTGGFEAARGKSLFVNDSKWCLASELDASVSTVAVHEGGYFDSYCTNEACTTVLVDAEGNERSGLVLYPVHFKNDGSAHLDDLEVAPVNNHVGISTLAITADHYIVVWQQGEMNIQSPGRIVATGSGSGDIRDLDHTSLRRTVIRGMERELSEEGIRNGLKLPSGAIANTTILGFFRWIARGGKPEFVGVTRLAIPVDAIQPDQREVFDVRKGQTRRKLENKFFVEDLNGLPNVIASISQYEGRGGTLSLPLKIILLRLQELFASDPDVVSEMLFGPRAPAPPDVGA